MIVQQQQHQRQQRPLHAQPAQEQQNDGSRGKSRLRRDEEMIRANNTFAITVSSASSTDSDSSSTSSTENNIRNEQLPQQQQQHGEDQDEREFNNTHNDTAITETSNDRASLARSASTDSACSLNGWAGEDEQQQQQKQLQQQTSALLQNEIQGIALLRQIFPDESTEELRRLHRERIGRKDQQQRETTSSTFASSSFQTPTRSSSRRTREEKESVKPFRTLSPSSSWHLETPPSDQKFRPPSRIEQRYHSPRSKVGQEIYRQLTSRTITTSSSSSPFLSKTLTWQEHTLPHNFLRLPPDIAVRRCKPDARQASSTSSASSLPFPHDGSWRYELVKDLAYRCMEQYKRHSCQIQQKQQQQLSLFDAIPSSTGNPASSSSFPMVIEAAYYTRSLFRDGKIGLGLTLYEQHGVCLVHSLTSRDGRNWSRRPMSKHALEEGGGGPALQAGIEPGDVLIGMDGTALLESLSPGEGLLQHAVAVIRSAPDPIVLHLLKESILQEYGIAATALVSQAELSSPPPIVTLQISDLTPSLLDTSDETQSTEVPTFVQEQSFHSTPILDLSGSSPLIHPFVATMRARGLIRSFEEERAATLMLAQFTKRTRQWETNLSFRIASSAPPYQPSSIAFSPSFSPSRSSVSSSSSSSGATVHQPHHDAFIPLMGVRQALCVRILHTFLDGSDIAYTIWVYDVDAGKEWYAPIRYFRDFCDLRSATLHLNHQAISRIPFPKQMRSIFGSSVRNESAAEREVRCRQLENFVRSLCAMIYRDKLHPSIAEISIHVQSFLGCESALRTSTRKNGTRAVSEYEVVVHSTVEESEEVRIRTMLKRSLQKYTYRLFLLDGLSSVVKTFIDSVRARVPRLDELEVLESQGRAVLKARAMKDLDQMKSFLNELQDIILQGCMDDFKSIGKREEYKAIHALIHGKKGDTYWERLVREAVREQVEIEAYVPLRSVVSRWLVNGWRHEDMEVHFKMKEMRKRPQSSFRIPEEKMSPTGWSSVASILKEGVGMSTLPCLKLRAIVDSAREISRLLVEEHKKKNGVDNAMNINQADDSLEAALSLGADDFLPIFIFCVLQADMERPCALCILLRTLCDPLNRMGEIGYYLASFEAAITHIQEVDLSEERDEMLSFLSVPLSDSS